ncbi:hypothetical protein [Sphingomonas limnosediminicola]|jgi:hypothetical protein|uniref:hypothetical protein n=1 Tax=Sphingomonas limnosediminicola TaxID=940133 RepID=UPI0031E01C58
MSILGRLLVLLAVLLMPVGMQPAAASAPVAHLHTMMAGTPTGQCPAQSNGHRHNDGLATCSMVCGSTLPAQELARDETHFKDHQLVSPVPAQTLHGILLEIATPPPKLA